MDSVEKADSALRSHNLLKRRSISLNTGVPLSQATRKISVEDYGPFHEESGANSSSNNVSTIVMSKLRSFGRQIHRHMIETASIANDASRGIPRSAVGDIYFRSSSPTVDSVARKSLSKQYRAPKLSLDLEDTRRYLRVTNYEESPKINPLSSSASKLQDPSTRSNESAPVKPKVSSERRLSLSAPHLEAVEEKDDVKLPSTSHDEPMKSILRIHRPREVSYDEQGQTWEIYGADQDPNALGQAIENHLEKMMQRKQWGQRCFSLGNEIIRQPNSSTKSSSRASHTGEQILQAARRRFRRRAVSSATPNVSTQTEGGNTPERDNRGRRSKIITYLSRILRRSSTSAIAMRRQNLLHQDSIVECGEQSSNVEKVMVSAT